MSLNNQNSLNNRLRKNFIASKGKLWQIQLKNLSSRRSFIKIRIDKITQDDLRIKEHRKIMRPKIMMNFQYYKSYQQ